MSRLNNSKKGSLIAGTILLFFVTIVVVVILVLFVLVSTIIKSLYDVPVGMESKEVLSIQYDYLIQSFDNYNGKTIEINFPDPGDGGGG